MFKKILVVGAGTMGHGIAQVFAQAGYQVTLMDKFEKSLERAHILIQTSLSTMVEAGFIRSEEIRPIMDRITLTTDLKKAAEDVDLAIECVVEDVETKKEIFKQMDAVCPAKTIFSSNSTILNVFDFVETSRPDRLLMTHWYAPAQIIPLVDVVKGPETSETHVREVTELLRSIGKKPVVFNKPCTGYIVTRLQIAFQREVFWLLDNDYVSPKDLDETVIWGLAMRMLVVGICQRIDFGGLDLSVKTAAQSAERCTPLDYRPQKLNELVDRGALGVKTGRGFYDYAGKSEAEMCHERDIRLLKLLKILQETDIPGPLKIDEKEGL